ncbi:hypothetical protein RKE29_25280 [Streptomyces sp. B1866]|uniref:hypothetical protein n=1 Tax=Streptomyces sp. B1866 TaxID=3075431 RepID=UPI00289025EE|nr:hypothetical protein [Streptomyces sp. B1866]MDT3399904.1 hypothetical protein [Streptomyces sp. B1866]
MKTKVDFLGLVDSAVRVARGAYPEAILYEGNGIAANGPTAAVRDVDTWRFVFRVQGGAALLWSKEWGVFEPMVFTSKPWLEERSAPWPISMDITEADELLKLKGCTDPYTTVTLRWPLYPGSDQPYYIFQTTQNGYVFVGVHDRKVARTE